MNLLSILAPDRQADRVVPPSGHTAWLTQITAGAMAFLAVFALALSIAAGRLADRWSDALERTATVRMQLEKIFERNGLPRRILTDNGSPWGTAGSSERHTVLTVWLMDLGVTVVHGRPYHPQTQGKDERFHRTLKSEVLDGRMFETLAQAQQAFDAWRHIYNTRRPHEALGLATPATRYRPSPRSMPRHVAPPDYEPQAFVRKVRGNGSVAFKNREFKASKAFAGKYVALRATNTDGLFDLCYRSHRLAQIDLRQTVANPSTMSPNTCSP